MTEELKVHTLKNHDPKIFETVDEFNKFYDANKDEIEKTSTISLNKMYLIKNHRIGRVNKKLKLYPVDHLTKRYKPVFEISEYKPINQDEFNEMDDIKTRLKNIEDYLLSSSKKKLK